MKRATEIILNESRFQINVNLMYSAHLYSELFVFVCFLYFCCIMFMNYVTVLNIDCMWTTLHCYCYWQCFVHDVSSKFQLLWEHSHNIAVLLQRLMFWECSHNGSCILGICQIKIYLVKDKFIISFDWLWKYQWNNRAAVIHVSMWFHRAVKVRKSMEIWSDSYNSSPAIAFWHILFMVRKYG